MFTRQILASALAVVACAVPASATISYYSDPLAFTAATSGMTPTSVSFDPSGQFFNNVTLSGVTFTGVDAGFPGVGGELTTLVNPGGTWPSGALLARNPGSPSNFIGGSITIALPSTAQAFAFYISYARGDIGSGSPINIAVAGETSASPLTVATLNTPYFFGAVTGGPAGLITISTGDFTDQIEIGWFSFDTPGGGGGGPSDTPESGSLFLMGLGLTALPLLRRVFARRQAGVVSHN